MLISDLAENTEIEMAYGVEIDAEMFDPPASLRTIGLLWEGDQPNAISDRLIDTVIAFNLSGAEVIVEVKPNDKVDHDYLLTLAGNAGFSVAAVPPETEADLEAWCRQCGGFAQALLTTPNFSKSLFPATGYMTYLFMEMFAGADQLTPTDPYTIARFYDPTPEAWANAAKAAMRESMGDLLGGEDALKSYLGAILKGLHDEALKHLLEVAQIQSNA